MKKLTLKMGTRSLRYTTPDERGGWEREPLRFQVKMLTCTIVVTAIPSNDGWTVDVEFPRWAMISHPRRPR